MNKHSLWYQVKHCSHSNPVISSVTTPKHIGHVNFSPSAVNMIEQDKTRYDKTLYDIDLEDISKELDLSFQMQLTSHQNPNYNSSYSPKCFVKECGRKGVFGLEKGNLYSLMS